MRYNLIKKVFLMLLLLTVTPVSSQAAAEKVTVGIVPFQIHSRTDAREQGQRVVSMMGEALEKGGVKVVFIEKKSFNGDFSTKNLRAVGVRRGVDYLIQGGIFLAGEKISMDAGMINIFQDKPKVSFYSEAKAAENLFTAVDKLADAVIGEIFQKKIITAIHLKGNRRIETDAVLRIIETREGDLFDPASLSRDLKKVFRMGYFDDVRIKKSQADSGVEITFEVKEKSSVRRVKLAGNRVYEAQEIRDVLRTNTGSILNIFKLDADVVRIESLYKEKNYHNCRVNYEITKLDNNQADILFKMEEGKKLRVEKISFEGNKTFSDKQLKKIIKTDEKGFFYWITSSGDLDTGKLDQDLFRLQSFYKNNGFVDSRVSDPQVDYEESRITIKFKIQEGLQYTLAGVEFKGDLILSPQETMAKIKIKEGDLYSRKQLREDVISLTDLYSDKGFANADIAPSIDRDMENHKVSVTFIIKKGNPVYFNRILITGNTKTRDKVIRRQLKVYEQELYSMSNIQRGVNNLRRIDYFENVDVKTSPGDAPDTMDLHLGVTEKATGAFSFGGGYSSEDQLFGMVSITERNFFGTGQTIALKAEISGSANRFTLSYTEPWLFDIPLSAGIDLYNWDKEYDYYDKDSRGGAVRLGYEIFDYTHVGIRYGYEDFTITNVDEAYTDVRDGHYLTSSLTASLGYDSKNAFFNPTRGSEHIISIEYAGGPLGGEIEFVKYIAETGWYFPLFWKFTGFLHGKTGFLDDHTTSSIDIDYERFYLGGMNSVRGYDWQDIYAGDDDDDKKRGGEKMIQFNGEITFPIYEKVKLVGVLFYDTGDVFRTDEDIVLKDLYSSCGAGFRWYSPMGPIRIEYGRVLNGNEYETGSGKWEFSMGAAF